MRLNQSSLAAGVIATILALPNTSWAKSELDLRITRLENIVQNELNINLLNQLDVMQQEIRELRGKLEEQQNALQATNQKQEKLFLNLDSRVNNLAESPSSETEALALPVEPIAAAKKPALVATEPAETIVVVEPAPAAPVPAATTTVLIEQDMEPTPPISLVTDKSAYEAAYGLMHSQDYAQAITEFKDYVWQFPEGEHAASAYYWLGEIYFLQWQQNPAESVLLEQAKESFSVATKYQGNPKELDALLKLGLIEIDMGNTNDAKKLLKQVINKQPNSSYARLAESKLKTIEKP